jgi:uncharacterized protein
VILSYFLRIGRHTDRSFFTPEFVKYFNDKGITVDISSTSTAAGTFNQLNSEDRKVVAALLTVDPWEPVSYEIDK